MTGALPSAADPAAAARAASAAAACAQTAALTEAGPASAETPGAAPTRPASNPTIAAPNGIETADSGNTPTHRGEHCGKLHRRPVRVCKRSLAAALESPPASAADTAASSASKQQAAADSTPAAAAQNPALQSIAATIETSPAIGVSAAIPAIADAAALALASLGDKHAHENGADLAGNGKAAATPRQRLNSWVRTRRPRQRTPAPRPRSR